MLAVTSRTERNEVLDHVGAAASAMDQVVRVERICGQASIEIQRNAARATAAAISREQLQSQQPPELHPLQRLCVRFRLLLALPRELALLAIRSRGAWKRLRECAWGEIWIRH